MLYNFNTVPGVISNLIQTGINIQFINISWNPPVISNGLITVYEIRYREHNDTTKPYATVNTTATQNSIGGLFPNTNYTIGVRAYTVIGPGQWVNTVLSTDEICEFFVLSYPINLILFYSCCT